MGDSGAPPAVGTAIGPYRLVRELGGGGMGVVYEAADEALGRTVALKLIAPHLARDEAFRRRFAREARSLAALDSAHVVQVHAYGEVDGRPYLVTQLVPDGDLGALLRQSGPPPVDMALDLVAQVAAGLGDVHEAGVVHGDIKPSNVLLRRRDGGLTAYLADFGVARHLGRDPVDHAHGTVGTPAFMAPELRAGGSPDVRTDVYSLGCLLWATLTGRPPTAEPVRLPGRSPRVAVVNRTLRIALAHDPAARYRSAEQVRDDLRRARSRPGRAATPSRVVLAAAALAVAAAATGWGVTRGDDARADPTADRAAATRNVTAALLGQDPALTPAQARCTARRWIADAGLARLVAEGYFADDMRYVDLDIAQVSEPTRHALAEATLACVTSG